MPTRRQVARALPAQMLSTPRPLPSGGGGKSVIAYYDFNTTSATGPVDWTYTTAWVAGDWTTYFQPWSDGILILQDILCRVSFGCYVNWRSMPGSISMQLYDGPYAGPVCDPLHDSLNYGSIGLAITYPFHQGEKAQETFVGSANFMDARLQLEYLADYVWPPVG